MEDKIIHYKLRLTTLTPVAIGGDKSEQLSPDLDFVFSEDGKSLHYLDLDKVEEAVLKNDLIDEFVRQTSTLNNNRSTLDLKSFLTTRFGKDISPFIASTVRHRGLQLHTNSTEQSKIRISTAIKNAGEPYLPGSSLKGALRTAMLYDWLVGTKVGDVVLKNNVQKIKQLDYLNQELYKLRLDRDRSVWGKIKDMEREARKVTDEIFNELELFGPLQKRLPNGRPDTSYPGTDARHIRVQDSLPLPPDAIEVYKLERIRITPAPTMSRGKGASIPQVLEAIKPGQHLETAVSILPEFQNTKVLDYWNNGSFGEAFGLLNGFSKACIDNEIIELRDALDSSETRLPFEPQIKGLLEFYEEMKVRAEGGAVFLRLGFGKTVNDNSLLLALLYGLEDQTAWRQFRRNFFKVRRDNAFFPVTRTFTPDGKPMGWVEVKEGVEK